MTDWQEKLPPIVRDRLAKMGDMTSEERQRMKDSEVVDSLLSAFYQDELDSEGFWERLRQLRDGGKGYLMSEVQARLIDSLRLTSPAPDVQRRKEGILALESLKEEQHTSAVEAGLHALDELQRRYADEIQRVYEQLRNQIERDPRLRMEQVRQGSKTVLVQLSVEEAVKRNPQWREFLAQHEKMYNDEFARVLERLKKEAA